MALTTVFFGTAPFGFPLMKAISNDERVDVRGVFTQPDRERGRGQEPQSPPVAEFARELNLNLFQPEDINKEGIEILRGFSSIDIGIVIAYGQILSSELLELAEVGFFNFHASLLPRWRGAAPIRHTLMAGDDRSGISVFSMEESLDTGPVCVRLETPVREAETYDSLYERLSQINVGALGVLLSDIQANRLQYQPQSGESTYADKIKSDDAKIDWNSSAEAIKNFVYAFNSDPGAFTYLNGNRFKIYDVTLEQNNNGDYKPGEIVAITDESIIVGTAEGKLKLLEVQPSGSRKMGVESYLAGNSDLEEGQRFDSNA